MKSSHYFAIAVRLFAILLFLYGLKQSTWLLEILISSSFKGMDVSSALVFVTSVIPLIVSLLLWIFPLTVSRQVIKPDMDLTVEPMDAHSVLVVLVLGIGLFAFYDSLTDAIFWSIAWNMLGNEQEAIGQPHFTVEDRASIWATGVEVFVSVGIMSKARSIAKRMLEIAA